MTERRLANIKDQISGLRGSVMKWSLIVHGIDVDKGVENCKLCNLFMYGEKDSPVNEIFDSSLSCLGCPVREITRKEFCEDTPYSDWLDHQELRHPDHFEDGLLKVECPLCRKIAQEELMFLQRILENKISNLKSILFNKFDKKELAF